MQNSDYFGNTPQKRGVFFYIILGILALFTFMGIGVDYDEFLQRKDINIPDWYFYMIFLVDALIVACWVMILQQKKIGVYLYPVFVTIHFVMHIYYLDTFLYSDVNNLFFFFGLGLLAFIPRWKYFK